ncbi:MAG: hypothetical protein ACXAD7_26900 [Candidatus Kariarchaeaceae archaeon]
MKLPVGIILQIFIFIILIASIFLVVNPLGISDNFYYTVDNDDQMQSTFEQGDLLLLKSIDREDIVVGDVLVYQTLFKDDLELGRVIDILVQDQLFLTSFDRPSSDIDKVISVSYDQIMGMVRSRIPALGSAVRMYEDNPVIRNLIVFVLAALILLIFGPYISLINYRRFYHWSLEFEPPASRKLRLSPMWIKTVFRSKKSLLVIFLIISYLVSSLFLPIIISDSNFQRTNIVDISVGNQTTVLGNADTFYHSITYYSINLTIRDSNNLGDSIKSIKVEIRDGDDQLIAYNLWHSESRFTRGINTLSFVLVVDETLDSSFSVHVELLVREYFIFLSTINARSNLIAHNPAN